MDGLTNKARNTANDAAFSGGISYNKDDSSATERVTNKEHTVDGADRINNQPLYSGAQQVHFQPLAPGVNIKNSAMLNSSSGNAPAI